MLADYARHIAHFSLIKRREDRKSREDLADTEEDKNVMCQVKKQHRRLRSESYYSKSNNQ